jgi:hypothetical protein
MAYDGANNSSYAMVSVTIANVVPDPGVSQFFNEIARPNSVGECIGNAIKADASGNIVVVGTIKGIATFGSVGKGSLGGADIFIAKYGPGGDLTWVVTGGGSLDDIANAVAIDATGNIYVTGSFVGTANFGGGPMTSADGVYGSDIFVVKYSPNGTHLWSKRMGGRFGNNWGSGIAIDPTGNVIVGGVFYGEADFGGGVVPSQGGVSDGFLVKLTGLAGSYVWSKTFGATGSDYVKGVAVDSLGDAVVVGYGYGTFNLGGGAVTNAGSADLFVAKYAGLDGQYLWSRVVGNTGPDTAEGVAIDANRNVLVAGSFNGTVDFFGRSVQAPIDSGIFLTKFNAAGDLQWVRSFGHETTGGFETSRSVAVDSAGNATVIGNASGGVNFGNGIATYGESNIYMAKYGPQGGYLWAKRSSNLSRCAGIGIATDKDRNVLSTGYIQGDASIDSLYASSPASSLKSTFLFKSSP